MNLREYTTGGNGDIVAQFALEDKWREELQGIRQIYQFFIVPDRQVDVARDNALFLVVSGSIPGQFRDLRDLEHPRLTTRTSERVRENRPDIPGHPPGRQPLHFVLDTRCCHLSTCEEFSTQERPRPGERSKCIVIDEETISYRFLRTGDRFGTWPVATDTLLVARGLLRLTLLTLVVTARGIVAVLLRWHDRRRCG